jgi:hypothetical protein
MEFTRLCRTQADPPGDGHERWFLLQALQKYRMWR